VWEPCGIAAYTFQDFRKPFGILGLSEEQIDSVCFDLAGQIAVRRTLYKKRAVAGTVKVLLEETGNKVVLNVKNRFHCK